MAPDFPLYSALLAATTALLGHVAAQTWRRRASHPAARWCFWLLTASAAWTAGATLETTATDVDWKLAASAVEYVAIPAVPTLYLLFMMAYTGQRPARLAPVAAALLGLSAAFTLVAWLNPWHGQFWTGFTLTPDNGLVPRYGPLWIAMTASAYGQFAAGFFLGLQSWVRTTGRFRRQASVLVAAASSVFVWNVLWISGQSPLAGHDLTPMAFAVMAVLLAWSIPRHDLLSLRPVARDRIFALLPDAVLVVDAQDRLVDLNPAAASAFSLTADAIGRPAQVALAPWPALLDLLAAPQRSEDSVSAPFGAAAPGREHELRLALPAPTDVAVVLSPFEDAPSGVSGRIVLLRDTTRRRRAEEALHATVRELELLATVDGATGAFNRRSGLALLEHALSLCARRREPCTVAFLDVDGLKAVNDALGHAAGDALILVHASLHRDHQDRSIVITKIAPS